MTLSDTIQQNRRRQTERQDVVAEFRYRQALSLTLFEQRCSKTSADERHFLVSEFESNADEMEDHGYYSHYRDRLLHTLTHRQDSYYPVRRHIFLKQAEAEALMMSYQLSTPTDRDRFKRHLIAGVVEQRPDIKTLKPDVRPFAKEPTSVLGKMIITCYQPLLQQSSDFNVLAHLSRQSQSDRQTIKNLCASAIHMTQDQGITEATRQLTDDLLPYYFREAKPYIASSQQKHSAMANYTAFYARPQKFFRMRDFISSFVWVFLTEHQGNQNRALDTLTPRRQRHLNRYLHHSSDLCHD